MLQEGEVQKLGANTPQKFDVRVIAATNKNLEEAVKEKMAVIEAFHAKAGDRGDFPLDGPQVTNMEIFRKYVRLYLESREDIHREGLTLLVRDLAPSDKGLPIEVYAFTKTTAWEKYEMIQAEIFNHLIAAAGFFDLRLFQQPSGYDLARINFPGE
jgi:miniconductance mechanosensitive channel